MRPATKRVPSGALPRNVRAGSVRPANSRAAPSQLSRQNTATLSPTNSVASGITSRARSPIAGVKRKERDYELEGSETNIHVVVRCRGRNDREVRENSGVVVSTEGARGTTVDLSMGPNALSNKTYHFDKVFSPAADQPMVYDDVVAPVLDEMISGYNCTIFAYGQTGTGKTYTMSGDMTDTLGLLSDAAGIIPRTLYSLFRKLEAEDTESTVKISFIELYNEELRDLLAGDDGSKLKLYDADQKKGHSATIVQGMEESHIKSAQDGIRLLQAGSYKRQVAATKCNDLSSRSHTVFTMTVYTKRAGDSSEEWVVSGKLNLVDLAGSENIQRSGAENKRAAEAGLINKSLLTLGRVINALVDKAQHIPYRESKLTRLLQDSLGGRTKTYIIATISPARSNLEETISTLDYAFRAKNIRNKPQINQPIQKKTLLREYTAEIQQLKSELIATRQRNGVYLSNDHYEQITIESESRRILSEEQKAKIETMEANLRNKVQDLFNLTNNLASSKKDNELARQQLDSTKDVLEQTEMVLADTKQNLFEETILRKAHQATEAELSQQGSHLIATLNSTVDDVNGLRAKVRRKSDMQTVNRTNWQASQTQVADVTSLVEGRVKQYQTSHEQLMEEFSSRMEAFVQAEIEALAVKEKSLTSATETLKTDYNQINLQSERGQSEMSSVLEEIKTLREDVKTKVGAGLQDLSSAAGRISAGVIEELGSFHSQLNNSYRSLGRDMKTIFDEVNKRLKVQKAEAEELRQQLVLATKANQEANDHLSAKLDECLVQEREQAATDRQSLISQISDLINANGAAQDQRMANRVHDIREEIKQAKADLRTAEVQYSKSMDSWLEKEESLNEHVVKSKDILKKQLQTDWENVQNCSTAIETTAKAVHGETVRVVEAQTKDIAVQMQALDDFVTRARSQNEKYHSAQGKLLETMTKNATESYEMVIKDISSSRAAMDNLEKHSTTHGSSTAELLSSLSSSIQQPLSELRNGITSTALVEYTTTGSTPQRTTYTYPQVLAKTASHNQILGKQSSSTSAEQEVEDPLILPVADLLDSTTPPSPSKGDIYTDLANSKAPSHNNATSLLSRPPTSESLRELPVNISSGDRDRERENKTEDLGKSLNLGLSNSLMGPPLLKRGFSSDAKLVGGKNGKIGAVNRRLAEGRENNHLLATNGTTGSGHGPGVNSGGQAGAVRLSASVGSGGRRLRSSARQD